MNENEKYIGKMLDDRYEILECIGEGGMAIVYKAMCHRLNRYVAVKIMRDEMAEDEEFRRRFCAESQAVAMLSHPNIVAVYDVSHSDDIEYIVMELIDGITLKQYMDRRGKLSWKETLHFSKQIAKALSHAHERGIIHRDIKPQNIMLLRDGTIKVGDFGIAALENEIDENNGQAIGSIHYIAPEQARGNCPDARSDIYSLGVVMYEMLTGQLPYTGDTLGEIAVKHMNADPVLPHELNPDIPPELESITLKAMAPKLEDRYQSAKDLLEDLEAITQSQMKADEEEKAVETDAPRVKPVRSVSELSKEKYKRRRRRASRVSFLSGTLGLLLLAIWLVSFLWNFWLEDVFSPAERIDLPNFVGTEFQAIENNAELMNTYSFNVVYVIDTENPSGLVLNQSPEPGRSMMVTPGGIQVELTVSSGASEYVVPDVLNMSYTDAVAAIQNAGFVAEIENATSDSVARNNVISSSPAAGESLSSGSTVYLLVSCGTEILYVEVPNLIGSTEDAARAKLESANLSFGGSERVSSDLAVGTVVGQSLDAFSQVEEHTKVYLQISSGPNP
ncbi:MAG: Stk1 family PASTA domain-containing Ser/Thr kinase [Candidatus Limivicinus sp.]|nr:Stk1 family PASTA domain-containing Ser/Thr kinase [Candidatus Limivicinus sp.]